MRPRTRKERKETRQRNLNGEQSKIIVVAGVNTGPAVLSIIDLNRHVTNKLFVPDRIQGILKSRKSTSRTNIDGLIAEDEVGW
jgi:hypothetical protein